MRQDFFPDRESAVPAWSKAFRDTIVSTPEAFGLDPEQSEQYSVLHDAFIEAYRDSEDPNTRTRPVIERKRVALQALEDEARRLSRIIQAFPGLTDADRVALRLSVRRGGGRQPRVGRPASPPSLRVVSSQHGSVTIKLGDRDSIRRGRPRGVIGALVFRAFAEQEPSDPSAWELHDLTPDTTFDVRFRPDVPAGTTVFLTACWLSTRLERGPFASAVRTNVPGGLAMPHRLLQPATRAA